MNVPEDLFYTKDHEWARLQGDVAVFGLSDYAQSQLSDIVFLDLPEVGTQVSQGEAYGAVEAVKAASDIYAPFSGEVVEVNDAVVADPSLVNQDPYGQGWLIKVKVSQADAEKQNLMTGPEYEKFISELEH